MTTTSTTKLHIIYSPHQRSSCRLHQARLSESDKDRLLFGEVGLTAFIVAEMQDFVETTMVEFDQEQRYGIKWEMTDEDKRQAGILLLDNDNTTCTTEEHADYLESQTAFAQNGTLAVELLCTTTQTAFQEGFRQTGLLSALGSAILYFRQYYRTPAVLAACERVGLSDYQVAHHITDMYHHRTFRGAYTKTLAASGKGEIAARRAVGLDQEPQQQTEEEDVEDNDECLLWSPTTPGVCLHWKSEDEAWRTKRFERIQMEGTRDPRRGGSGTTR
ncbi:expressed unknown protein [Seminavis robusta]|uniref:Uncharacterized protein n=1 Tax=Seminavis robusta TaxID=568900 RepID=A0A9N8F524_9STRA|nr:expressed unknown protein [Seminavis robusta]|eukprot:Sro3189_g344920.1 n/a (274) ;mRNA; r:4106-4927